MFSSIKNVSLDLSIRSKLNTNKIIEKFKEGLIHPVQNEKGEIIDITEPEVFAESQSSLFIFLVEEKEEKISMSLRFNIN